MRLVLALVALVGIAGMVSVAGCLQVDSPDGALICSANPKRLCPEGYYCLAGDNTCWHIGDFPQDMAGPFEGFPDDGGDMNASINDLSTEPDLGAPSDQSPPGDALSSTD